MSVFDMALGTPVLIRGRIAGRSADGLLHVRTTHGDSWQRPDDVAAAAPGHVDLISGQVIWAGNIFNVIGLDGDHIGLRIPGKTERNWVHLDEVAPYAPATR